MFVQQQVEAPLDTCETINCDDFPTLKPSVVEAIRQVYTKELTHRTQRNPVTKQFTARVQQQMMFETDSDQEQSQVVAFMESKS